MHIRLGTKITVAIAGVLVLAFVNGLMSVLALWQLQGTLTQTVEQTLPSVKATEELEIALLEQRGLVSAYLLDNGNTKWLEEFDKRERAFRHWLEQAKLASNAPEEAEVVTRLLDIYHEYLQERDEAVTLYREGHEEDARKLLLGKVRTTYQQAFEQCEHFIAANERHVAAATRNASDRIRLVTGLLVGSVALTAAIGIALFLLFYRGVLSPLRRLAADAASMGLSIQSDSDRPEDELKTIGKYLQVLLLDVADTRSHLQRSRAELLNAQRLASVGKLAASVAHEIRNPLTSVKLWLFSIRKTAIDDDALLHKLDIVGSEIDRLERIVHDFLEFSRPPELRRQSCSLPGVIDKTLELIGPRFREKRVTLKRNDASHLPDADADLAQLKQVYFNVVQNALDFSPDGGEVSIETKVETDSHGHSMLVTRVKDSGPGMSPETVARLFEPFFTTRHEGTGLGLCIAAHIMARHGGRVVVESTSPHGTTFAVFVPKAETRPEGLPA